MKTLWVLVSNESNVYKLFSISLLQFGSSYNCSAYLFFIV